MPPELTLETLGKNIADINVKLASFMADHTEEEQKKKEAKKAQNDKEHKEEEEKKEAKRAARIAAVKKAMEEPDDEKKDAALKKAMNYDDKDNHTAMDEDKHKKEAMEEKEDKEHMASIIEDKRQDYIKKILTANSIMNPTAIKAVESRLKTASLTEIKKEWTILQPAFEGAVQQATPQEKFVPYFANITPTDIDNTTLTAASPDSDFAKFTTQELLEMSR